MRLIILISVIFFVNGQDPSTFNDDYYNGMKDYDLEPQMGVADFLDRLTNMMAKRGKTFVI